MSDKKIKLGLDLGTNSIGWALVDHNEQERSGKILGCGSRIIPMSQDVLGKFDSGVSVSQTAERTRLRSARRLRERFLLRRERLHRVLNCIGFLPEHYAEQIDFNFRKGKFLEEKEPKIAYRKDQRTQKHEFLFKNSFAEMVEIFKSEHGQLHNSLAIPYDWTIYYLRKKALTEKINKEELAWLLLNFNQKRGYHQLRGEDEVEDTNKKVEYVALRVIDVQDSGDRKGKEEIWYNVTLENGWIYRRTSKQPLDWIGKVKEFIVTTEMNEDGSIKKNKDGKEARSFRAPAENDWTLVKKKTEFDIEASGKTVGAYIFDTLVKNPVQKIKGALVRVVERKFYRDELRKILESQSRFHSELQNQDLLKKCLEELYPNNLTHSNQIQSKGFEYLLIEDILLYQRPLKSKKSLISNCKYEFRTFTREGKTEIEPLKGIPTSHPLFQEFRLIKFIQNLRIYEREKNVDGRTFFDLDVTNEFLRNTEDYIALFNWLSSKREIDQKAFLKYPPFNLKKKVDNFRWNYVEDKSYPCYETRAMFNFWLDKLPVKPDSFFNKETEEALWHILYSVNDKDEIKKALASYARKYDLNEAFAEIFKKFPPFELGYGAFSTKATKKLLSLMRFGPNWKAEEIDSRTLERIDKIISGEFDDSIRNRVREKAIQLTDLHHFQGLPEWLASYIVYDRHSEDREAARWKTALDIEMLEQHSLRNPIVEQVINETLKVVRDIWIHFGQGKENYFDEIHVELGREMKNPAEQRKNLTRMINENENTNLRIKQLLAELKNHPEIENVRPYSPSQQEILKLYEEGVLLSERDNIPDDVQEVLKAKSPSQAQLIRYKLWLEQKYISPYTGQVIPLSKLFTSAYEIEHIIPQSRFFDDSLSNKVICEQAVNKDKDKMLSYEYIKNNSGKKIELGYGKVVSLFTIEAYENFVKRTYGHSKGKLKKLLSEDIPEVFVQRQLNDARYISKVVKSLLSNVVRKADEQDATAKNLVVFNGAITSQLKQDWGLNDVWNDIIAPRFERMNEITQSNHFGEWTSKDGKRIFQTSVPLDLAKGFSKKRIDHRHHALDAIVLACATRSHVNYLNNEHALGKGTKDEKQKKRYDLQHKLCFKKLQGDSNFKWSFHKPWDSFTTDTKEILLRTIVSFKGNLRTINRTVNKPLRWVQNGEISEKKSVKQDGINWAIRKPLHKDTVFGKVSFRLKKKVNLTKALEVSADIVNISLRNKVTELKAHKYDLKMLLKYFKDRNNRWEEQDISKVEIYYWDHDNVATRTKVDDNFTSAWIDSITDAGIRKIMKNHLARYDEAKGEKIIEHPELAFSPDGIDEMNRNILELNDGKPHKPILKVRTFEPLGNKFQVGQTGNKKTKYVEAAKGTNLFFAIYADEKGTRSFETIPLNLVIERQKQGLSPVPEKDENQNNLLMVLSPDDLVYVSKESQGISEVDLSKIYRIASFTGSRLYAVPVSVASTIVDKAEFSQLNKMEFSLDELSVKQYCVKLKINRLGILA
jgi:CRISPR-associated endonuclease Csn1